MPKFTVTIDSILGGIAPNLYRGGSGQFSFSLGIDPDQPLDPTETSGFIKKTAGVLVPSSYADFTGALLDSYANWLITCPQDQNIYCIQDTGKFLSYASTIDTETHIDDTFTVTIATPAVFTSVAHGLSANDRVRLYTTGALPTGLDANTQYFVISAGLTADAFELSTSAGGAAINTSGTQSGTHRFLVELGNGAAYYNNYVYIARTFDISRYGPLDNSPVMVHGVWRAATLGSQTALGNATYPTIAGVLYPNHPMHVHVDNKLYVGDFETATTSTDEGRGKIHWIRTNSVTDEGDTNNGTTQNAFLLPPSYAPIDIESWGNDLAILAIPMHAAGIGSTIVQGKAAIFLWDAINAPTLPYRMIPLIDPFASALLNHNGNLYVWSGNLNNGVRVSKYLGGYNLQQIAFFEEGIPPPAGAVDGLGNRISWGAFAIYPESWCGVYAYGYKDANIPQTLHNIITASPVTAAALGSSNFMVTAIKYAQQASFTTPRLLVAWKDGAATPGFGIDKLATSAEIAVWRSLAYAVGRPFRINKITIPLGAAIASGMTLVPTIWVDEATSASFTLTTINSTNYAGSQRRIVLYPAAYGQNNFALQLRWSGTVALPVTFPIVISGETLEDATG